MIAIVRMKAQETQEKLWDEIVTHLGEFQDRLRERGRLLYLSQRARHEDVSLFVHVAEPDVLGSLVADQLSKVEHLTGCWIINMLKPVFFPLPRDTRGLARYAVTLKIFPARLAHVYEDLSHAPLRPGIMLVYLAYTCHLYGDCMQFSALGESEEAMGNFLAERVETLPGVLHTTVNSIERTKPLVSYDEWKEYSTRHSLVPSWDEAFMLQQFTRR